MMKRTSVIAVALVLAAGLAQAQAPSASLAAPVPKGSTQSRNVQSLSKSLTSVKTATEVTPELKSNLKKDLLSMAVGPKPDATLVDNLVAGISENLSTAKLSEEKTGKLAQALGTVMNSAASPAPAVNNALTNARSILSEAGVASDKVDSMIKTLEAIAGKP